MENKIDWTNGKKRTWLLATMALVYIVAEISITKQNIIASVFIYASFAALIASSKKIDIRLGKKSTIAIMIVFLFACIAIRFSPMNFMK